MNGFDENDKIETAIKEILKQIYISQPTTKQKSNIYSVFQTLFVKTIIF